MRRTLAFSIHELAVILGDQLTAADLVPIFNGFLKDLDEVRIGVLKHLFDFLKVRPAPTNPVVNVFPVMWSSATVCIPKSHAAYMTVLLCSNRVHL